MSRKKKELDGHPWEDSAKKAGINIQDDLEKLNKKSLQQAQKSKSEHEKFREGWELIFGKKKRSKKTNTKTS